jgi:hypothetical protein
MGDLLRKEQAISLTRLLMHFRFLGTIGPAGASQDIEFALSARGLPSTGFSIVSFQRAAWSCV